MVAMIEPQVEVSWYLEPFAGRTREANGFALGTARRSETRL
jgi:hypothetical protein